MRPMIFIAAAVWISFLIGGGVFATEAFAQQGDDSPGQEAASPTAASESAAPEASAPAPAPAPPPIELEEVVDERMEGNQSGVASQKRIDGISDETDTLASQYRTVIHQIDALRIYNAQVETLVVSQNDEIADFGQQIDEVELVSRQVTPLMLGMIGALENFVELDVPFLPEERTKRIAALRDLMQRSDITDAERYRRILEAYQVENEYGRTIEAYEGELALGGSTRTVDYLRVGRVVFIYQTRDETESGVWDQENRTWKSLGVDSRSAIRQGLRIARKQAAPDLLRLPVPSAKVVQ